MSNQELKHYGVLGMKWGISRSKDVVNNNPQLRKLKDNVKNSPQVRKAQDKVNEYKSKLKKKVSR